MAAGDPLGKALSAWGQKSFASLFSNLSSSASQISIKPVATHKGEPSLTFSNDEIQALASPFRLTLVGKFSRCRPTMESLCKEFHTIGLKGEFILVGKTIIRFLFV